MSSAQSKSTNWWGPFEIPHGHRSRWRIGPLNLRVQRLEGEWRLARAIVGDAADTIVEHETSSEWEDLLGSEDVTRFGVSDASGLGALTPALADLPIVSTPERPFSIPPLEKVRVFVGHPAWVQVHVGAASKLLTEFPIHRPSDTWFGPDTQQGEICYASRSFCRLRLAELAPRPHRFTTAVTIHNRAKDPLYLQQMKLPVPFLSVFATEAGSLWTEDVVLERLEDHELAPLRVLPGAPDSAPRARALAPARLRPTGNVMIRAFSALFS